MNHGILVAPLALGSLEVVDNVSVSHCPFSIISDLEVGLTGLTVRRDEHPGRWTCGAGRSIERKNVWTSKTSPDVDLFDE